MPRYRNGYIPDSELVIIEGNHKATRGTAARWEALKADVLRNEGVTLRITGGENAYRSYAGQVFARNAACRAGRCDDAAVPGFSSHGGSLNGRDSGAIDVSNWADIGKDKFYNYCRRNGFEPGYFDWEPWHIIDWDPYNTPSAGGGGSTGEEDMNADQAYKLDRIFESVWTPAYGSKVDATINVVRNEAIPATARAVLFPNQPFNGFQALANNQTAMMEMIKALDPSKSADIEAFEVKLRESEARTIEATKQAVEASGSALRSEILAGLAGVEGVDPEIITSAVDEALDRVFVRTPGS